MRASLWYRLLDLGLRTTLSAKQCCNQVPLAASALSIPTPWKESKTEPCPIKSILQQIVPYFIIL